jgi:hypothetical protein
MNAVATQSNGFVVRSDEFGYGMWAAPAFVGDITDQPEQAVYFSTMDKALKVADAWSRYWGYKWTALACVS